MQVTDQNRIKQILDTANIADGLQVVIGQGELVVDTAHYDSEFGELFEVRMFESKIGSQDFTEPSQIDFREKNYSEPHSEFYETRSEMLNRLMVLMQSNHY